MADLTKYPKTDQFQIINTIGIPHPFCITHHHVCYASDNHGGLLGSDAIKTYEASKGGHPSCGVRGCNLTYAEHETALLVEVTDKRNLKDITELHAYLLECKSVPGADKYAGFAFKQI